MNLRNSVRNIITFSAACQFTKLINAVSDWPDYRFVPKLDAKVGRAAAIESQLSAFLPSGVTLVLK